MAFGERGAYSDGLAVTVTRMPHKAVPKDYLRRGERPAQFEVLVENGTGAAIRPTPLMFHFESAGRAGNELFLDEHAAPYTALLPGRSVRFPMVASVRDPADVIVEVRPGGDQEDSVFFRDGQNPA